MMMIDAQIRSKFLLGLVMLLLLVLPVNAQGQSDSVDMLGALDIVRAQYGEDVAIERGFYNTNSECWQIDLADTSVCVRESDGVILELTEPLANMPTGAWTAIFIASLGLITFLILQGINHSNIGKPTDTKSFLSVSFPIVPNRFTYLLGLIAGYLALQSIVGRWIQSSLDDAPHWFDVLVRIMNINLEQSLPTWYATILLAMVSALALIIALDELRPYRAHWFGLSALFALLSVDEAISIHEELTIPLRETFNASGFFYFSWIIVGVMLVAIIGIIYLRFVWHLPAPIRNLTLLAGAVFVGGGIVIEGISAGLYEQTRTTAIYSTIGTVEELFEMMGVIVFIRALLLFYQHQLTARFDDAISGIQA